jgi:4-hydroxybenzoyl-CoA thioesterase
MTFIKPYIIRLSHCDPTGTVFYPNYFHIFNALVEDWFYEGLEMPYHEFLMQRGLSLPTVKLETTFLAPSRMGERVDFWLTVSHLGNTSMRLTMGVDCESQQRVRLNRVAVCVSQKTSKPVTIPADLREKIAEFMRG